MLLVMFYASLIIIQSVLHLVRFDVRQLTFYDSWHPAAAAAAAVVAADDDDDDASGL